MRERMLAGELYVFDDPELVEANAAALDLMAAYNATTPRQEPLRRALLERLLGAVGNPARVVRTLEDVQTLEEADARDDAVADVRVRS